MGFQNLDELKFTKKLCTFCHAIINTDLSYYGVNAQKTIYKCGNCILGITND